MKSKRFENKVKSKIAIVLFIHITRCNEEELLSKRPVLFD